MFWIDGADPGRLAIAARPRAGDWLEDEIESWRVAGVGSVVSLLEPDEIHDLGLEKEQEACLAAGITFTSFPILDRGVPTSLLKTRELVAQFKAQLFRGGSVLVHCRAGIGRSSLIAACILKSLGHTSDEAFARIGAARGLDTPIQREWVDAFAIAGDL